MARNCGPYKKIIDQIWDQKVGGLKSLVARNCGPYKKIIDQIRSILPWLLDQICSILLWLLET